MEATDWKVTHPPDCPHCHTRMEKMDSRYLDWGSPFLWVCFNDDCPVFQKGREHMLKNYQQSVSMRVMIHPENGEEAVIPALSYEFMEEYAEKEKAEYPETDL